MSETFVFQAEINQLLSLIINAFYSNKEIFLRELISNASDAIDKIRYDSLTNPDALGDSKEFSITVIPDKASNTLTIQDTGIGMTKQDLIKNLGTIAHSGTRAFMESIQNGDKADVSLIGQFGVGFYSAYLVAKNVKVVTKHNDDAQYVWESNASGSFTISEDKDGEQLSRGTKIVLELKDDHLEYLEEHRIREVVKKHSEFCSFPIMCMVEKEEEVEVEKEEEEADGVEGKEGGDGEVEEVGEDEESDDDDDEKKEGSKEKEKRIVKSLEQLNTQSPIWLRKPDEVSNEEYATFYRSISNDWEDHLCKKHFSVDGQVQLRSLLYIPKRAPFNMFSSMDKKRNNVKLYVKKVLISDDTDNMLPEYLSFIQGVVDSDDLPLNVSREMLQQNSIMKLIKKNMVKKCIEMMTDLAADEDKSKFETFYGQFNKNIKLGVHEDTKHREKLMELLKYHTSKSDESMVTLREYISRMKDGQTKIYYITGESVKAIKSSPFLERLKKRGIEVIYMSDPMDEYMMQSVREYDQKPFVCCSKEGLDFEQTDEEKKEFEELAKAWEPVCKKIKSALGDNVSSVKITERLVDSPCILVTDRYGWSANMERIVKAQALNSNDSTMMGGGSRKIMEINPDHAIIKEIKSRVESDKAIATMVDTLYQTSLIDSGFSLAEPSKFAQQIYRLLSVGICGDDKEEENESLIVDKEDNIVEEETKLEEVD